MSKYYVDEQGAVTVFLPFSALRPLLSDGKKSKKRWQLHWGSLASALSGKTGTDDDGVW